MSLEDGAKVVKGSRYGPGAVVLMHCTVELSNGKPCGLPAVEREVPFRCPGHLYIAEYGATAEPSSIARAKRSRPLPLQAEKLFQDEP